LNKAFEEQKRIWQDFLARCTISKEKLNRFFDEWSEFQKVVEELENWMKNIEGQVKDQSLKSTEEAKTSHLQKLKALEQEIIAKAPEFNSAVEKSQSIEAESELVTRVSKQATKYQALKNQARESVSRYEKFVKEHSTFNQRYNDFVNSIRQLNTELKQHGEIVGDFTVLQKRQKVIRDLADMRTKENPKFESVIDLGEKLYTHTSPDGREIVRQQLRNLRTLWDSFSDDLQISAQKLDQCLMQFAEFSLSQEQLSKWLRDVERAMHQHTELKSTLEEKRAQLQNHKIMHQEIMSHHSLVEAVCEKAQQLVDQTKDTSLNIYLQSIKQLFNNIVSKSRDLLDNLEDCADKHNKFNIQCKAFSDWLQGEKEKLLECNDFTGERTDISRRLATLSILKDGRNQGMDLIKKLKDFAAIIVKNTASKGQGTIRNEIANLETNLTQHLNDIGMLICALIALLKNISKTFTRRMILINVFILIIKKNLWRQNKIKY
jgi:nesprin-1